MNTMIRTIVLGLVVLFFGAASTTEAMSIQPQESSLRKYSVLQTEGLTLWVTVDDLDFIDRKGVREDRAFRLVNIEIEKTSHDDSWLIDLFQNDVRKTVSDTDNYDVGLQERKNSFDLAEYDDTLGFNVRRKFPKPRGPSSVGAGTNDASAIDDAETSISTGSFTPSNNLIVISAGASLDPASSSDSISDTFSDTLTCNRDIDAPADSHLTINVYTCTGWSSGAGAITVGWPTTMTRMAISADAFSGVDSTTPVSETNTGEDSGSTLSIALVGVAGDNRTIATIGSRQDDDGITVGTGETELVELATAAGGNRFRFQTQYGTSVGTDTPADWSDLNTAKSNTGGVIELAASGAAAPRRVIIIE